MDIEGSVALVTGANRGLVAAAALDGVEAGDYEVLVDAWTRQVRAGLSGPVSELYPALAAPAGTSS